MGADMRKGLFDDMPFGQLALQKLGDVPENFRIYVAGIKPEPPKEWTHMEVTGAEFREAKSGPQKGQLNIMIPGTRRTVRVPRSEIEQVKNQQKNIVDPQELGDPPEYLVEGIHAITVCASGPQLKMLGERKPINSV